MIILNVNYDYFWCEVLSLLPIMIIFDVNDDNICSYLCLCDVYLSLNSSREDILKRKTNISKSTQSKKD